MRGEIVKEENEILVCRGSVLVEGGIGVKVRAEDRNGPTSVFFVRFQGRVYGYVNRCAHVGVELDWEGSFFTRAGNQIMCARHGAVYEPDTGLCVGGPCRAGRLKPVAVTEREEDGVRKVFWMTDEAVKPSPVSG